LPQCNRTYGAKETPRNRPGFDDGTSSICASIGFSPAIKGALTASWEDAGETRRFQPMRLIRPTVFGLLCGLAASIPALAETAIIAENAPWTMKSADHPGFCTEIINEMATVLKTKVTYEFAAWPDAQAKVMAGRDLLIFPLARVADREPNYVWMQKLFDISISFAAGPGKLAIDSFEQAKTLPSVAVLQGTPWQKELSTNGFTNVKVFVSTPAIVAALMAGEVAAAYSTSIEMNYALHVGGFKEPLVFGKQIHKLDQFLAASKDSPSIKLADWQEAFNVVQQEGTFDRIYAFYFGAK
jgi:polar amino acid transport system substrate-binding protein